MNENDYLDYKIHQEDLDAFAVHMKKQTDIEFKSMSYDKLWIIYDAIPEFVDYSKRLRERYKIRI